MFLAGLVFISSVILFCDGLQYDNCKCGERRLSNDLFDTKVVGIGAGEARVNEFPWAALLEIGRRGGDKLLCGGTLINDR